MSETFKQDLNDPNQLLRAAVLIDNPSLVQEAINRGANANRVIGFGTNLLFHAESAAVAKILIDNGADVNAPSPGNEGLTPALNAIVHGRQDVLNALEDSGKLKITDEDMSKAKKWLQEATPKNSPYTEDPSLKKLEVLKNRIDNNIPRTDGQTAAVEHDNPLMQLATNLLQGIGMDLKTANQITGALLGNYSNGQDSGRTV